MTRLHIVTFAVLLSVFTILTFLITYKGVDEKGSERTIRIIQTTMCTITGPMTGAICRGFQQCCLKFSLGLMAYCAPVLLIAIVAQFIIPTARKWQRVLGLSVWTLGWLVWFLGGILSFFHALS